MIAYTTVGTNDMARATAFYDALFAQIGGKRLMDFGRLVAWGVNPAQPMFSVCAPYDGKPATAGNGTMVALAVKTPSQVDALYKKALELGGTDEGAAGQRGDQFYIGYFRDLDGNKLNFFCMK